MRTRAAPTQTRPAPLHTRPAPPHPSPPMRPDLSNRRAAAERERAEALGRSLADELQNPDDLVGALARGLRSLADPVQLAEQRRVAPGIGRAFGVRWPVIEAVQRGFRVETRHDRGIAAFLAIADRLLGEPELELHWFAFGLLERTLADDPERSWQLLRRAARQSADWITVDALAHPWGRGILAEPYRWSELEQLVFSPSRWERRMVGSTIATLPFVDRAMGRGPEVAARGLSILESLLGDDDPTVQKALAWALRNLTLVDRDAVERVVLRETAVARESSDGNRAAVLRDTTARLSPTTAARVRADLTGIRRRAGGPSTSAASRTVARFAGPDGLPNPLTHPEPRQ